MNPQIEKAFFKACEMLKKFAEEQELSIIGTLVITKGDLKNRESCIQNFFTSYERNVETKSPTQDKI